MRSAHTEPCLKPLSSLAAANPCTRCNGTGQVKLTTKPGKGRAVYRRTLVCCFCGGVGTPHG